MYDDETENGSNEQQALEPVEQESVLFHDQTIIAVRLADGRICVVIRWICDSLKLQRGGQIRKIERTAATASELVRVRVQTKGGKQTMPAITLRGFSPWMLSINPNEVKDENPVEEERIRALVIAYQEEAKDALYEYFVSKRRTVTLSERAVTVLAEPLAEPQKPELGADAHALTSYYEDLAVWALWQARQHAQEWRGQVQEQLVSLQDQLESEKAVTDLIPEIIERLGPETITPAHQGQVKGYVKQLHELTGKPYPTIYDEIRLAFGPARYQDLLEADWTQIENWFKVQIERAKRK